MAFDGIAVACVRQELENALRGGYIAKIAQPESDELLLTVKNNGSQHRLLLSASASLPLVYLTDVNRTSPLQAPNFCMLLRKHIGGGRILEIQQPGLERVLDLTIEHRDEMGDLQTLHLILELMGKHSNLILTDDSRRIIDAIKHVSFNMSSVREVLPGREWFIPDTQNKINPLGASEEVFRMSVCTKPVPAAKAAASSFTGFSYIIGEELCFRAGIDGGQSANTLSEEQVHRLWQAFDALCGDIRAGRFSPAIYYRGKEPADFSAVPLHVYDIRRPDSDSDKSSFFRSGISTTEETPGISAVIRQYYSEKELVTRIRQKSSDLRRIVNSSLERCSRTLSLQEKQLKDTEKKDRYRIYGELLNTYGYSLEPGAREMEAVNYYTDEPVTVPLDPQLSASENAKKYFDRYSKLKRTAEALQDRLEESRRDVEQLRNIAEALEIARGEEDLSQIRQELTDYGYIHSRPSTGKKKKQAAARPLHYISSDGFDIYVGKNNYQNDEVSFRLASGSDWWFHANDIPGSHVIVRGGPDLPDTTFEEAGRLAAYYSSARTAPKVEIDYTQRKNLHRPTGGRPGFVVYYTNYSMMAEPDIRGIQEVQDK